MCQYSVTQNKRFRPCIYNDQSYANVLVSPENLVTKPGVNLSLHLIQHHKIIFVGFKIQQDTITSNKLSLTHYRNLQSFEFFVTWEIAQFMAIREAFKFQNVFSIHSQKIIRYLKKLTTLCLAFQFKISHTLRFWNTSHARQYPST